MCFRCGEIDEIVSMAYVLVFVVMWLRSPFPMSLRVVHVRNLRLGALGRVMDVV